MKISGEVLMAQTKIRSVVRVRHAVRRDKPLVLRAAKN